MAATSRDEENATTSTCTRRTGRTRRRVELSLDVKKEEAAAVAGLLKNRNVLHRSSATVELKWCMTALLTVSPKNSAHHSNKLWELREYERDVHFVELKQVPRPVEGD